MTVLVVYSAFVGLLICDLLPIESAFCQSDHSSDCNVGVRQNISVVVVKTILYFAGKRLTVRSASWELWNKLVGLIQVILLMRGMSVELLIG